MLKVGDKENEEAQGSGSLQRPRLIGANPYFGLTFLRDKTNPDRKINNPIKKSKPSIINSRLPTKVQAMGITNKLSKPITRPKVAVKTPPTNITLPVPFMGFWTIAMVTPPVFVQKIR